MAQQLEARPAIASTGVPNLDPVLGGGLQEHNSYMIVGASGTGKSILSLQIAFHWAKQGHRVLLLTGLTEPHRNLLEHLATLSFTDLSLIGPQIETVSIVPFLERPVSEWIDVLRKTVLNTHPHLVVVDGLRSLEAYAGGPTGIYQFLYGLTSWLALEGITLLLLKDVTDEVPDEPELSLVDGIIILRHDLVDGHSVRRLQVQKMRGQQYLPGLHSFSLDENGIVVWPRPEIQRLGEGRPLGEARASFGIPSLDPMLQGGPREGTCTLLAGALGTGKTIAALAFLTEGIRRGQHGLWLGFRESRRRLLAMGKPWSSDLVDAEPRRLVEFVTLAPTALEFNQLAQLVKSRVESLSPARVVLDAAEALESGLLNQHYAGAFEAWLVAFLAERGVTSLITQRLPRQAGGALHTPDSPLASLAENVLIFRQVEKDARMHRLVTILKMAQSGYDPATREFTIDPYGITVGDPFPIEMEVPAPGASMEPVTLKES